MEMRNGMIVWAPTDAQMNEIRKRVSKERAKAASEFFAALRSLFQSGHATALKKEHSTAGSGCPQGA